MIQKSQLLSQSRKIVDYAELGPIFRFVHHLHLPQSTTGEPLFWPFTSGNMLTHLITPLQPLNTGKAEKKVI